MTARVEVNTVPLANQLVHVVGADADLGVVPAAEVGLGADYVDQLIR